MNRQPRPRQDSPKTKPFWGRLFHGPRQAPESQLDRSRRSSLSFEMLEDRITPDSRTFGGLIFDAGTNLFNGQTANTPVNVRLAAGQPDVLRFDSGVTLSNDNVTFTTPGIVRGMGNGTFLQILNASTHTFNTTNLNAVANSNASGVTVTSTDTSGVTVPILASVFTPNNIKIVGSGTNPIVQMEGSAGFAGFSLLTVPINSGTAAQLSTIGAVYNKDFNVPLNNSKFEFKKIEVETENVNFGFKQATQSFYFNGAVKISNEVTSKDANGNEIDKSFDLASAQLGDETHDGIVINSQGLASVHIIVNANFYLKGLKLSADDLTISYRAATSQLEFSGGVSVYLNSQISFSAAITLPIAINTETGDVTLPQGLGIRGSLQIGTFGAEADIKYVPGPSSGSFTLDADVLLHMTGFDIGGSFSIVNGNLTAVGLSYDAANSPGIAIGNTGLFLTKFSGALTNLDAPSKITVTGSLTAVYGKKISVFDQEYSIFDATGTFTITPSSLNLTAQVNLVGGYLGKGSGSIDINWDRGEYKLRVNAELLSIFTFNGSLDFDNSGNITLNANAGVKVPDAVPVIGGTQLFTANVYLQIRPAESASENYVAAWVSTDFGFLGKSTLGFQSTFEGKVSFLTAPPVGASPYTPTVIDTNYPFYTTGQTAITSEPGVDAYLITVTSPRFAQSGYNGSRDYLELSSLFDLGDGQGTYFGNPQHTINPSTPGDAFNTANRTYAILPNTTVPQESGQYSYPGATPSERVFVVPRRDFVSLANGNIANGDMFFLFASKDNLTGTANEPTFKVTKRYVAGTSKATTATVNASGVTTITVTGKAYGPEVAKTRVEVFRTNPTNPFAGVLVGTVLINPNDSAQYNKTTGVYTVNVNWNGLPDLVVAGQSPSSYAFFSQVNNAGNPVVRDPLKTALTNSVTSPNPQATVTINSPTGFIPDPFSIKPYVKANADAVAPGGFSVLFGTGGPNIAVSESFVLPTVVTVKVDRGGFVGTGTTASVVAGAQSKFTSSTFSTPAQATTFLNGLRFVANAQFTGKSTITVSVATTTATGKKYEKSLAIPVLRNPFFLDPTQGIPFDTQGIFGQVNSPFYNSTNGYQLNFASSPAVNAANGPYTFQLLNGDLHGLTLSASGRISGTPTTATGPAGAFSQDLITLGVFDKYGASDSLTYGLQIAVDDKSLLPSPVADTASVSQIDSGIYIFVLENDILPAKFPLSEQTVVRVSMPTHGTVSNGVTDPGTGKHGMYYIPNPGFLGDDTFTYKITNDLFNREATVTVQVTPILVDNISNINDGKYGPGEITLLEAIEVSNSNGHSGKQTITFDPIVFATPQTITLDTTALVIRDIGVNIIGPGAGLLTINGNSGVSTQGVFVNNAGATSTISGVTVTNGQRGGGGGILNFGTLTLNGLVITGNKSSGGNGGGIENYKGTLTVLDCTITGNKADFNGGGISSQYGTVSITNSTVSGNTAAAGGGVFSLYGTATLTNVTISDNHALDHGGGIANPGTMTIVNSTITRNVADADNNSTAIEDVGGDLYTSDLTSFHTTMHNTIIAGNYVNNDTSAADDINGVILLESASSFNLIGNPATAGGLTNAKNGNIVGNAGAVWNLDAILDRNLRDNGGSTLTHALITGGPAVNKGSNAAISGTTTDQRGSARIVGSAVDIGAVEIDTASLFLNSIDDGDADNSVFPNQTLTYTLTFNQDVNAATVTAADFSNAGTAAISIGTIAEPTPGIFTVQVTPTLTGTVVLRIPTGAVITSTTGKNLAVPQQDNDSVSVVSPFAGGLIVDNTSDVDDGVYTANNLSLREAVRLANESFGADTISFNSTVFATAKTITLGGTQMKITDALTITGPGANRLTINGNNTSRIFELGAGTGTAVTLTGLTLTNGRVTPGSGGAIVLINETLTLSDCVITGSSAALDGGAIYAFDFGAQVLLNRCTFSGNTASRFGGAINMYRGGTLNANNCTFNGNTAQLGGAITAIPIAVTNTVNLVFRNCTITGNTASSGGGIASYSTAAMTIDSSIVSGNTANNYPDLRASVTATISFSAIGSADGFTANSSNNLPFGSDLKLGTLKNNGGTMPTIALGAGSTAINAGSTSTGLDSRSFTANGTRDIGAFEVQAITLPATLPGAGINVAYSQTLTAIAATLPVGTTFTYAVTAGSLPPGLTLSPAGLLNGTPTTLGNSNLTITATASTGDSASKDYAVAVINNTPPTISTVANQTSSGAAVGPIAVIIGDSETPAASLVLTANSSNTTLVANPSITFGGSGTQRTVTVTPVGSKVGTATITLTVTDGNGVSVNSTFTLTVKNLLENEFSVGRDRNGQASVTIRNPDNTPRYTLTPFGANFTGGIRTASGDFNGDGVADLVCASGPGMPGQAVVFDGVTQQQIPTPLPGNQPFGSTFTRGIIVAVGDLNNDGLSDLIITAEAGGGARVRIFQSTGSGFVQRSDFIALIGGDNKPDSVKFRGGSRATVSDINGDGTGDLIWAAGAGGGPRVATFDGKMLDNGSNVFFKLTGDFFVLSTSLRDGAYLAGGDVNGDGIGDVIAGGGSGAPPQVVGFSGATLIQNNFSKFLDFNFGTNSGQGVRVAVKDLNHDNIADVIVGSAPGAGSRVAAFDGNNLRGSTTGTAIFNYDAFPGFSGGVFVG
ncbi:hypothetical protein BH11PLA2_BH11PLA2_31310 [soil metagenome]